jgi:hypothetical protein
MARFLAFARPLVLLATCAARPEAFFLRSAVAIELLPFYMFQAFNSVVADQFRYLSGSTGK